MQLLADFFPLILFFIAFKWQGIFFATSVAIVASIVQIAFLRWKRGHVAVVNWLSLAIILVFGGATLILQDEAFIKWKPTVLYALFGVILAAGRLFFRRNLLSSLMAGISLPEAVWSRLTWSWVAFFAFMGVANWYVAFHYPTDTWVSFKVWGGIGLFMAFALAQGLLLARHVQEKVS
jgi:intracellular septation protein